MKLPAIAKLALGSLGRRTAMPIWKTSLAPSMRYGEADDVRDCISNTAGDVDCHYEEMTPRSAARDAKRAYREALEARA